MTENPKISIVIPVYNGANYLHEAIDSALAQTYTNKEIIVVNDGSNDEGVTEQIALSYGDKIRYFNKPNGGVASALNKAILEMTGEYFSWLSHDDLYFPDKLTVQMEALLATNNPKTVIYSDFVLFQNNANDYLEIKLPHTPPEQFRYFLTVQNSLHGCTLLIPKAAFMDCGLFDENLRYTQDYDLWFKMARYYQFSHITGYLVKGRQHKDQDSLKMQDKALLECNLLLVNFINDLSATELKAVANNSLSLAYTKIFLSMQQRGFVQAKNHALKLVIHYFLEASLASKLRIIYFIVRAYCFDPCKIKIRHFLTHRI